MMTMMILGFFFLKLNITVQSGVSVIPHSVKKSLLTNTNKKIKKKLATLVEGDPKAPFSIAYYTKV